MSLRVAVTRTLPEATHTADRVRALGAEAVITPLLQVEPHPFDANLIGVQALIFTSANGVRVFAAASQDRSLPAYTVGDASAAVARDAGFTDVRSADGDIAALAKLIRERANPSGGKLLHISGARVARDLAGFLNHAGIAVERRVAYEARPVSELPEAFKQKFDVVLFHSARAAEIFAGLNPPNTKSMIAACLSPAVEEEARKTKWKRIVVASAPREDDLLKVALKR